MAYDERLAERVRKALNRRHGVSEKRMFGGLSFLIDGNMSCGIVGDELMVRVGPDAHQESLTRPHARKMDFTGRALIGYVYVAATGLRTDADLKAWVDRSVRFARTLPAK